MRIGIDAKNLTGPLSGISRYIASMVEHLAQHNVEIVLFAPSKLSNWHFPQRNVALVHEDYTGRFGKLFWSQFVLPHRARAQDLDVFWGPSHRLSPLLPAKLSKMLTVHDLVWQENPETMTTLGYWGERLLMPSAIRMADRIITPSVETVKKVTQSYPAASAKAQCVYPGTTRKNLSTSALNHEEQEFALFVGTIEPRKNLQRLVKAFCALPLHVRESCHLKIVGAKGWKLDDLDLSEDGDCRSKTVEVLGFVPDSELEGLYQRCRFLALPSLSEGFGLPIIEAQKYGKPVLTSNCSALPEVAKDGALYIDPFDVDSIKDGLRVLITDNEICANLSYAAQNNAERFSWTRAAEQFLEIAAGMQGPMPQHAKGPAFLQNA